MGTAIPLIGTYLLFMPYHLCALLGVRIWTFLRQAYLLPVMLCIPLVAVLLLMQRWFVPHSYRQLALHLLAGGLVYGACMAWVYVSNRAFHVGELAPATDKMIVEMSTIRPAVESYEEEI
jgi:hypothetical protein